MKTLSALLLSIALSASFVLAQRAPATATAPAAKQDPTIASPKYDKDGVTIVPRFAELHENYVARAKEGNVDLLFLGDSITYGWGNNGKDVWKERYESRNAANFGIGGDRTQHVLWRIENGELENIKPKVIVLMIGTNNTTARDEADKIAEGVTKIVKTAQAKTGAKVLLLGVFPRGQTAEQAAASNDPKAAEAAKRTGPQREAVARINEVIAKLDDGKTVRYLDLKDKFLQPDGTISKEIMPDYLHLTPAGYKIWGDAMEPLLSEMLGN